MTRKLWKDFYTGLKPYCQTCLEKGIAPEQYLFCSPEKQPLPVHEEKENGRKGKLIYTFSNIYACQVYHWTKFQGQGRIEPSIVKKPYKTPTKNNSHEQNYAKTTNQLKL